VHTPDSSIDKQLSALPSAKHMHRLSAITVFGHTPFMQDPATDEESCEVYDLQGRWLTLAVPARLRSQFQATVTPYAITEGTDIDVYVTWKSPYLVTATYAAAPGQRMGTPLARLTDK
jgi:hypothetical protein